MKQNKATARMRDMMAKAHLMVMVSHDLGSLAKLCTRVIWMDHGRLVREGDAEEVIDAYREQVEGKRRLATQAA